MGKLYVIGIGPGSPDALTAAAKKALDEAQALCGYTAYVQLLRPYYPGKEIYTTPMTGELARCHWALEQASAGKCVAMVCSGDAGVYGMAGPVLELAAQYPQARVEILPGVTAALSGGALLGAPLGHDFCVISLSDRLIGWEQIEKRLACAADGDFVICLYNPASRHRPDALRKACDVLLKTKNADAVCGMARCIGREGERIRLLTLAQLRDTPADMFTTVFIGSSETKAIDGRMVTPRGYRK